MFTEHLSVKLQDFNFHRRKIFIISRENQMVTIYSFNEVAVAPAVLVICLKNREITSFLKLHHNNFIFIPNSFLQIPTRYNTID